MRSRFAPSPTGDLHLGGAFTALAAWVVARAAGGAFVLRVEDLDPPRVVAGSAERIAEDLAWLGLTWDEGPDVGGPYGPYAQSERTERYREAVRALRSRGLVYPCDCSRKEIARAASAPHAGEELRYPGTCRDKDPAREMRRPPALRLAVPEGERVSFVDGARGPVDELVAGAAGDFVLERADGVHAYQLAVSVDDGQMQITHVLRGRDLLPSTARQILLLRALGLTPPSYTHLPMVVWPEGDRIAKRDAKSSVRALRERGVGPGAVVGWLAHGLGLAPSADSIDARALADAARARGAIAWRTEDVVAPAAFA